MLLALPAGVEKAVAARVQLALSAGVVKAVTAEVVALTAGVVKDCSCTAGIAGWWCANGSDSCEDVDLKSNCCFSAMNSSELAHQKCCMIANVVNET